MPPWSCNNTSYTMQDGYLTIGGTSSTMVTLNNVDIDDYVLEVRLRPRYFGSGAGLYFNFSDGVNSDRFFVKTSTLLHVVNNSDKPERTSIKYASSVEFQEYLENNSLILNNEYDVKIVSKQGIIRFYIKPYDSDNYIKLGNTSIANSNGMKTFSISKNNATVDINSIKIYGNTRIPLGFGAVIDDDFESYAAEETPLYFSKEHATHIFKSDGNGLLTNVLGATVKSNISLPGGGSLSFNDFVFDTRIKRDVTDNGGALLFNFVVAEDTSKNLSLYIFRQKYVVKMGAVNLVEKNFSTVSQLQGCLDSNNYLDVSKTYDLRLSVIDDVLKFYIKESTQQDYALIYETQNNDLQLKGLENRALRFISSYNSLFNFDDLYLYLPKLTKGLPQKGYTTIMNEDFEDGVMPSNFNLLTGGGDSFYLQDGKLQKADGRKAELEVLYVYESEQTRDLLDFEVEAQFILKDTYSGSQSARFITRNPDNTSETIEVWIRDNQMLLIVNGGTQIGSCVYSSVSSLVPYLENSRLIPNTPYDFRFGSVGNNLKVYMKHATSDDYIKIIDKTDDRINVSGENGLKRFELSFDWTANIQLDDLVIYENQELQGDINTRFYDALTEQEITYTGIIEGQVKATHILNTQSKIASLTVVTALYNNNGSVRELAEVFVDTLTLSNPTTNMIINVEDENQIIKVLYLDGLNNLVPLKKNSILKKEQVE